MTSALFVHHECVCITFSLQAAMPWRNKQTLVVSHFRAKWTSKFGWTKIAMIQSPPQWNSLRVVLVLCSVSWLSDEGLPWCKKVCIHCPCVYSVNTLWVSWFHSTLIQSIFSPLLMSVVTAKSKTGHLSTRVGTRSIDMSFDRMEWDQIQSPNWSLPMQWQSEFFVGSHFLCTACSSKG